jgi:hypothetical protein
LDRGSWCCDKNLNIVKKYETKTDVTSKKRQIIYLTTFNNKVNSLIHLA